VKTAILLILAAMTSGTALAGEVAVPAIGAGELPSLCIVGRSSGRAQALLQKPKSKADEQRELDAVVDALLRCPTADEKVQTQAPVRHALPTQNAYRLDETSIPAGNG
jgi:hypothetical protein